MGTVQHIAQPEGKHAAVPQCPLGNIGPGHLLGGLFLKHGNLADGFLPLGDDIAVLFAGIGGLNAHEHQVGIADRRPVVQGLQGLKIVVVHIGVHGADHHRGILGNSPDIPEIGGRQGNGRKGIPAAGLHADAHVLPQLIVNGGDLGFGGGDGHGGLRVYLPNLPVDPLDHGFQFSIGPVENLDKLLGTDIIGKGPQPLAGAAG